MSNVANGPLVYLENCFYKLKEKEINYLYKRLLLNCLIKVGLVIIADLFYHCGEMGGGGFIFKTS